MVDERLNNILNERDKAIQESNNIYNNLINKNDNLYNQQQSYANEFENTQNGIAEGNYNQAVNLINQNKEQAEKDKDIERQKAYNSYLKVTNPYGSETESLGGLNNSGYSETFKLGAYNTYQQRAGRANDTYQKAVLEYNNEINEAKKNYDTTRAENALKKLQMQLQYAESYNNNNQNLTLNQLSGKQNLDSDYNNRYMDMINQINTEKQREEQIRQFNEQMAYQKERDRIADEQWQKQYALSKQKTYSSSSSSSSKKTDGNNTPKLDEELQNGFYLGLKSIGLAKNGNVNYTPKLSSEKANIFYKENLATRSKIKESELENIIRIGMNNKALNEDDAAYILKAFGKNY